jgi:putative ABC transport system permease protein
MTELFGIPIDRLALALLIITGVIIAGVLLLALRYGIFFKIGVRNIFRRRLQMVLIVFALMLSTTLLSSVLTTSDVLTSTVHTVAVLNWGNVDELIEGGRGELGTYSERIYNVVRDRSRNDPAIEAVGAALRIRDLLVADQSSRQVRSKVTALGILPGSEQGFGGMIDQQSKNRVTIADLASDEVYLNLTTARLLNARPGDQLYLYSKRWPGQRYAFRVAAIVSNDGLVGDNPFLLTRVQALQQIENQHGRINQIFVANADGVASTGEVSDKLDSWIPGSVHVIRVKQEGVENSQKAQDIFSRIFVLFTLFALAIGLLLIFLIFVLLAAERRTEMGMVRAIGAQRSHLVLMYLFEGTVYDLIASFVGLLSGLGAGALLIYLLGPVLERFNFPLKLSFQPHSFVLAYCLGVIFTFCSVVLSAWLVSRMTIVEAIRDQPESRRSMPSLREQMGRILTLADYARSPSSRKSAATSQAARRSYQRRREHLSELPVTFLSILISTGILPLLIGLWLMQRGLENTQIIPFSLGFSCIVIGIGLFLKTAIERGVWYISLWLNAGKGKDIRRTTGALLAALVGLTLTTYYALPFDILASFGLPRFQGSIEIFFIAGMLMVLGTTWAIIANIGLLMHPLLAFCAFFSRTYALLKLAAAYPLHRRFRVGLSVIMFSLVVFAMTVMAIITQAMQNTYVDINNQTGGYDIEAKAYFKVLPDLHTSLARYGVDPNAFSAIGTRNTTAAGIIQLGAANPRWHLYPAQVIDGDFLKGYGLHLTARANGFANDEAIWRALQTHPDYALIDSRALRANPEQQQRVYDPTVPEEAEAGGPLTPPGIDPAVTFTLGGTYTGDTAFPAVPVWVVGTQGKEAVKLTIIGIVDNSDSAHFGLYIPRTAYTSQSLGGVDEQTPDTQSYYFKVAPGQDKQALALALGSAFLDYGMETTVLEDAIWQVRGPRIFLSNVLLGVVGMTLLLGVAALAITGTRAVIERRQQIGMLRALGCERRLIQGAFLLESFLVGVLGSVIGSILGVLLAKNIFDANFLEQYQTGLVFSIPWQQLALIIGVSLLASFLGALLPAWQAGKVTPAEALRYT